MKSSAISHPLQWIVALVLVVGCSSYDDDSRQRRSSLVFDLRQVSQSRNHLRQAATFRPDEKARQLDVFLALQSMATGTVWNFNRSDVLGEPCRAGGACDPGYTCDADNGICIRECVEGYEVGSGVLSSGSRLMTAHHVVYPYQENQFAARFGGSVTINDPSEPIHDGGRWLSDFGDPAYRHDDPDWPKHDFHEENALFANRLFQLGLDGWSTDQVVGTAFDAREHLRTWQFRVDIESTGTVNDDRPFSHQRMVDYSNFPTIEGRDIAFLMAEGLWQPLDERDWGLLNSGSFPLTTPGLFFDHVPVMSVDWDDRKDVTSDTPFHGYHAPDYPTEDSADRTPVISRVGRVRGEVDAVPSSFCIQTSSSTWENDGVFNKTHTVSTTLDSIVGSSGGAALTCPSSTGEEVEGGRFGCRATIDGNAIEPGTSTQYLQHPRVAGVMSALQGPNVAEHIDWHDPVPVRTVFLAELPAVRRYQEIGQLFQVCGPASPRNEAVRADEVRSLRDSAVTRVRQSLRIDANCVHGGGQVGPRRHENALDPAGIEIVERRHRAHGSFVTSTAILLTIEKQQRVSRRIDATQQRHILADEQVGRSLAGSGPVPKLEVLKRIGGVGRSGSIDCDNRTGVADGVTRDAVTNLVAPEVERRRADPFERINQLRVRCAQRRANAGCCKYLGRSRPALDLIRVEQRGVREISLDQV